MSNPAERARRSVDALAATIERVFADPGIANVPDAARMRATALEQVRVLYTVADYIERALAEPEEGR